ncbi:HAD-IA family hydrolase [Piscinibacter sp.]|uniref:HAD family hydrolase n=1 Tax=Piscinibacter sp. TaxID=1903157 RepID=UPI001B58F22A|nr:HAD-IA family hydrolase [Piscinibacter sp.]MBK7531406.1 HAD-IA family hydrolase [Piscinibacter sp.]MBP6544818.1 HAD-IA family hydrolase [Piscinibacter sp.]
MNVVFDFAGVLFHWQPPELLSRLLPHRTPDEAAALRLVDDIFQGYTGDWGDFDRGTVEPGPLAERIARRTGLPVDEVRRVIDGVPDELTPIAGTVALLRELHAAGRPLYFLSNMPEPYAQHLEATHDFLGLFRDGVFSARARLCKPEPEIFAHCERRFGLDPAHTIFIDDVAHNVAAARAAGWRALQFIDPGQCGAALRAEGAL